MAYTNRLKLCMATDILGIVTFAFMAIFNKSLSEDARAAVFFCLAAIWFAAATYINCGKYRKWRNLWRVPELERGGVFAAGFTFGMLYFKILDGTQHFGTGISVLLTIVCVFSLLSNIRTYKRAVKYNLENLRDVNELVRLHPEVVPYINRKPKKKL